MWRTPKRNQQIEAVVVHGGDLRAPGAHRVVRDFVVRLRRVRHQLRRIEARCSHSLRDERADGRIKQIGSRENQASDRLDQQNTQQQRYRDAAHRVVAEVLTRPSGDEIGRIV